MRYGSWSRMERPLQFFHKPLSQYELSTELFLYGVSLSKLFATSTYVDKSYCYFGVPLFSSHGEETGKHKTITKGI